MSHMNTFLHSLKRILEEKYPNIEFAFYLSSRSKNVHMGLNCNLLLLSEHVAIISDIENIWMKRKDTKFKFVVPELIRTTSWKFDFIIFTEIFFRQSNFSPKYNIFSHNIIRQTNISIEYKRISSAAHVPKRAHNSSAGYDLWSPEKF